MKSAYAAVLNQQVKDGKVTSWSWLEHVMGGPVRRALVLDGPSHKGMLSFWSGLAKTLEAAAPDASKKFSAICHSHSDYVWDLK